MSKEQKQNDLIKVNSDLLSGIQETINECLPVTGNSKQTIEDSLIIANGLNKMRDFFKNEDVKKLVETMKDTTLGFLTDKPKGLKKWNKSAGKKVEVDPYTYEEITEALIPMMLEGYRFTGNEINIISGKGMPVKAGKFRRIIESTDAFQHTVGTPQKEKGIAKMRCQAKWIIDGKEQTIGFGDDLCVIAVEYDDYAGLDKLVGLAESKLYSRVLTRITGKFVAEGEVTIIHAEESKSKVNLKNATATKQAEDVEPFQAPIEEQPGISAEDMEKP